MARKAVVEVQCDRCTRVEHRGVDTDNVGHHVKDAVFSAYMAGAAPVTFQDLCAPCFRAVANHLEAIGKKIDGLSPDRQEKPAKPEIEKLEQLTKTLPKNGKHAEE